MPIKSRARPPLIGNIAERTGVNVETIRYYERIGLLPHPARSDGRHRVYEESHVRRLSFIRRSRELGFPIDSIRMLLDLADGGQENCLATREITVRHLAETRGKIASLKKLERALKTMTDTCKPGAQATCPIIDAISAPGPRVVTRPRMNRTSRSTK